MSIKDTIKRIRRVKSLEREYSRVAARGNLGASAPAAGKRLRSFKLGIWRVADNPLMGLSPDSAVLFT